MNHNQLKNHIQGSTVATILAKSITEDFDVAIVTRGGATTGEDGPRP